MSQNSCSKLCLHHFCSFDLHSVIVLSHSDIEGICVDLVELWWYSILVEVDMEGNFQENGTEGVVEVVEHRTVVAVDLAEAFALDDKV